MINFLIETITFLASFGKTFDDVRWIGDEYSTISIEEFKSLANFMYDNGYGRVYINTGLRIVGDNWWITRYEYDGSEGWEFHTLPTMPQSSIKTIIDDDEAQDTYKISEYRRIHNIK